MDYEGIRKRAAATIAKNGKNISVIVPSTTSFDPATGLEVAGATTIYAAKAVEIQYSQSERSGTMIQANDRRFLVAGLQTSGVALPQIKTGNRIEVSDIQLEAINVMPLNPGETNVIYEVQARK